MKKKSHFKKSNKINKKMGVVHRVDKRWCPYVVKQFKDILHIFDPIYRTNLYYVCCRDYDKFRKIIKKQLKLDLEDRYDVDGRFIVIANDKEDVDVGLIWCKEPKLNIIAHECLHAVAWVMRDKHITLSVDSEETFTYFLDFLIRAIINES